MKKILVIEDEEPLRKDIIEILECLDFEGLGAENGVIGVNLVKEYLPDLIICDIMMPELDGYGVLKSLRQSPETAIIPFIFLSAKADKADIRQGMKLGADDYLTKPFTIADLEEAIVACLDKQAVRNQAAEMLRENENKFQELAEQQELLHSLTKQLRDAREIKAILNTTLIALRNLLQTHRCSFLLYRGDKDSSYFELIDESSDPKISNIPSQNSLQEIASLGEVMLQIDRLWINDINQDHQLDDISSKHLASLGFASILAVSIQIPSGEVGVLVCEHFHAPRRWTNNEIELLQAIADQLPIAL